MKLVRAYRVGSVTALPAPVGEYGTLTAVCDAARPVGHTPRGGSLFAAPDLLGATRWVRSALMMRSDVTCHALHVDPTGLRGYRIGAWDAATVSFLSCAVRTERFGAYWASGIPLSEWTGDLDGREWEVLVPVERILG